MSEKSNCPHVDYIDYAQTGTFSKIALDYIAQQPSLKPFYQHEISKAGIEAAIKARADFPGTTREVLAAQLELKYHSLPENAAALSNIKALRAANTFTVTTAHQPNILGGPLYLIYKIIHVIRLARELSETHPHRHFVPVYYMGSEDADLEELNHIQVEGKTYAWETDQTGAVGRMLIDEKLLSIIDDLAGQIGVTPHGGQLIELMQNSYQKGAQIQDATLHFLHGLFGRFGLIILIPDNPELKRVFEPVVLNELLEMSSHKAVERTASAIAEAGYKVQTHGREINLFYLTESHRERIEKEGEHYTVPALGLTFTTDEITAEVKAHPERFSGNVVLRGPFQETILPNIIFVGGGGELAYWLEMKGVYHALGIPYPMLLLRNSFTLIDKKQTARLKHLGLTADDFFRQEFEILNLLLDKRQARIGIGQEVDHVEKLYQALGSKAAEADPTLQGHVEALWKAAGKKLKGLAAKMDRAQRQKLKHESDQVHQLKLALFPGNNLQERTENFASFYGLYGPDLLDQLLDFSKSLASKYGLIYWES